MNKVTLHNKCNCAINKHNLYCYNCKKTITKNETIILDQKNNNLSLFDNDLEN